MVMSKNGRQIGYSVKRDALDRILVYIADTGEISAFCPLCLPLRPLWLRCGYRKDDKWQRIALEPKSLDSAGQFCGNVRKDHSVNAAYQFLP